MRTFLRSGLPGLLGVLSLLSGIACSNNATGPVTSSGEATRATQANTTTPTTKSTAPAKVELKPTKFADFEGVIKQHRGKVVLVDFWADW